MVVLRSIIIVVPDILQVLQMLYLYGKIPQIVHIFTKLQAQVLLMEQQLVLEELLSKREDII